MKEFARFESCSHRYPGLLLSIATASKRGGTGGLKRVLNALRLDSLSKFSPQCCAGFLLVLRCALPRHPYPPRRTSRGLPPPPCAQGPLLDFVENNAKHVGSSRSAVGNSSGASFPIMPGSGFWIFQNHAKAWDRASVLSRKHMQYVGSGFCCLENHAEYIQSGCCCLETT